MIDDVIFDDVPFILEYPTQVTGSIEAFSLDGGNYEYPTIIYTGSTSGTGYSSVFVS